MIVGVFGMYLDTLYDKNGKKLVITAGYGHKSLEIYINEEFYCSCENKSEMEEELQELKEIYPYEEKGMSSETVSEVFKVEGDCFSCNRSRVMVDKGYTFCLLTGNRIGDIYRNVPGKPGWCPLNKMNSEEE